jgi:acetyl/propionyl-CoA carboxylase alpha subunit
MIKRVLIANRGAIAVRILRTLRARGWKALRSMRKPTMPRPTWTWRTAPLASATARLSDTYLNGEALLAIALQEKADAIHPGYGFLSENPAFARPWRRQGSFSLVPPRRRSMPLV